MAENNLTTKRQEKIITQLGGDVSTLKTNLESERWDVIDTLAVSGGGGGLDTSDATATAEDILKDKTAYVNGEKVTGIMEVNDNNAKISSYVDSSSTTLNAEEMLCLFKMLDFTGINLKHTMATKTFYKYKGLETVKGLNMSNITSATYVYDQCYNLKTVEMSNTNNITLFAYMFQDCQSLIDGVTLDTSSATNMVCIYKNCTSLENVPLYNTTKVTMMNSAFSGCTNLSNEALNNILLMCANTSSDYSQTKTLAGIGLTSSQATTCTTLSNYQAFLDAGWTTGY